uniref:Uncharacterized protein n=1 Tax=Pseudomonas phage Touem01 TaxID=3138548 RepID=A0AAU6W252_9VIRU
MKHEFKPGDLAMTVNLGVNTGKAVELIEHLGTPDTVLVQGKEIYNLRGVDIWKVKALGDPMTPGKEVSEFLGIGPMVEIPVPTQNLMPLRGDEHDDLITTERPAELVSA